MQQAVAPAVDSMRADRGASLYLESPVDVRSDPMSASGVDLDTDLSMVASGGQLTVVRGVTQPRTPTLQETLLGSARSTTRAKLTRA